MQQTTVTPRGGRSVLVAAGPATSRAAAGQGLAGGLTAVSMWGLAPVATRALVTHAAPVPILVLRLLLAALVLLPWAVPVLRTAGPRTLARLGAAGVLGMVGYNLPVTLGLQWLPASTAGLLLATEPLWVLLMGRIFLAETVACRAWVGTAVALIGVAILAGPAALSPDNRAQAVAGTLLVLLATAAFGGYTVALRPLSAVYGAVPATAASSVVGALPYLALAGTLSPAMFAQLPAAAWGQLMFLSLGSTVIGMLLWNQAILRGGSTQVSLLLYLEPVVSVLGAMAILGEVPSATIVAGGAVVIVGVFLGGSNGWLPGIDKRRKR